jgi:hypothetical protein
MKLSRSATAVALGLMTAALIAPTFVGAQDRDRDRDGDRGRDGNAAYSSPLMRARTWHEVERAGDTWDGLWTFDDNRHRTITATWVDRQTGARVSAPRMIVRERDGQIVISRPGTGDYVGRLSADGTELRGTMSWIQGSFTARVPRQ